MVISKENKILIESLHETRNTFWLPHIATFTMNERTVSIIMAGCIVHAPYARNGYISTCGLKSGVIFVFLDPDFL